MQSGVDLTRAENDAVNLLVWLDVASLVCGIGDDPLELRVANELLNVGTSKWVTEEGLGEENDERYRRLVSLN
jgi:hypothetical protein